MARINQNFHNLPSHAHLPDDTLYVGTGIPATGFNTSIMGDSFPSGNPPIELGLKTQVRFGGDIPNTSVDSSGEININVPSGGFVGNPNLAKWNFAYDVDQLPVSGRGTNDLLEKPIHLLIDMDPSANVKYLDLVAQKSFDWITFSEKIEWVATDNAFASKGVFAGTTVISDDGHNNAFAGAVNVTQNSENIGFFKSLWTNPAYNYQAGGHFDVALVQTEYSESGPQSVAYNTATGNLIGIPANNAMLHEEFNFV